MPESTTKLTPHMIETLMGRKMNIMEVYDYTARRFMSHFIGSDAHFTSSDVKNITMFRDCVESMKYMADYKLAALVMSLTAYETFRSWDFCPENPLNIANPYVIANIITLNKKTGKFESNPCGWFGYGSLVSYRCLEHAEKNATKDFTRWMVTDQQLLKKFLDGYRKTY